MKWLLAFLSGWFRGGDHKGAVVQPPSQGQERATPPGAPATPELSDLYERVWERIEADKEARRQAKYDALLGQVFGYTLRPYSETQLPSPTVPLGAHPLCDQIVIAECIMNLKMGVVDEPLSGELNGQD